MLDRHGNRHTDFVDLRDERFADGEAGEPSRGQGKVGDNRLLFSFGRSQNRAQPVREAESELRVHRDLGKAGHLVLDGVLDRDELEFRLVEHLEDRVHGRRLAGTSRPRDEQCAVRFGEDAVECRACVGEQADLIDVDFQLFGTEKESQGHIEISEKHTMRYWFRSEINFFLKKAGFKILHSEQWMTGKELSSNTWYACYVVQKN